MQCFASSLNRLFFDRKTRGVVILSGDVHMSSFQRSACGFSYNVTEFTSSGLTHSLLDNAWTRLAAPLVDGLWRSVFQAAGTHVFVGRAFGGVEIDWDAGTVRLSVLDAGTGQPEQTLLVQINELQPGGAVSFAGCERYQLRRYRIEAIELLRWALTLAAVFAMGLGVLMYCQCARAKRGKAKNM